MSDASASLHGEAPAEQIWPDAGRGADPAPDRRGSWADRLTARLERGRVPAPLVYLGAWLGVYALLVLSQWASGSALSDSFRTFQPGAAAVIVGFPWLIGVFNRAAARAMRRAVPLVIGGPERGAELELRLVSAPARLTLGLGLAMIVVGAVRLASNPGLVESLQISTGPPAIWVELGLIVPLLTLCGAAYLVKIVHLAWQLHRITTRELRVDIWELGPLLSFAGVTARMAASTLAILLLAFLLSRQFFSDVLGLVGAVFAITLAGGVFALPLLGLHGRILAARSDAQTRLARLMERAIDRLDAANAADELSAMDPINKEVGALETALRTVGRIQTWPWEPELFRWVVGALLFPVALFVIQYLLSQVLPR